MRPNELRTTLSVAVLLCARAVLGADAIVVKVAILPGEGDRAPKAGVVELLTTELTKQTNVVVVEREEIARVLAEQKLSAAQAVESSSAIRLGRLLGADGLAFVERIGGTNSLRHRVLFVESVSGVIVDSRFSQAEKMEKNVAEFLSLIQAGLRWLRTPEAAKRYVGFLGYSTEQASTNTSGLADALTAMLTHQMGRDSTVLVVDRQHLDRLRQEKDLTGEDLRLALSSFLIEGQIRSAPGDGPGMLEIDTLIRPLGQPSAFPVIRRAVSLDRFATLPSSLAAEILKAIGGSAGVTNALSPSVEAEWFRSHAEYLTTYGQPEQALPAAEAAFLLKPTPPCARLLAKLLGLRARRTASAVTENRLTERQKQLVIQDLIRAARARLIYMEDFKAKDLASTPSTINDEAPHQYRTSVDPYADVPRLRSTWRLLRSDDSQTREAYTEMEELHKKMGDVVAELCRHHWRKEPYRNYPEKRNLPALGVTGYVSHGGVGAHVWYLSLYLQHELRDIRERSETAAEYTTRAKAAIGMWLDIPGYTSPYEWWSVLHALLDDWVGFPYPQRFADATDRLKVHKLCEWMYEHDSPHVKAAALYFDAASSGGERRAAKARQMLAESLSLVQAYGNMGCLDPMAYACLDMLPKDEYGEALARFYFEPPLERLDARGFAAWCNACLHSDTPGRRSLDGRFLHLEGDRARRWLDAASAKLPPPHLARYRSDAVQSSITSAAEQLDMLRAKIEARHDVPRPVPAINRCWETYGLQEAKIDRSLTASHSLAVMERQGERLVTVWTRPAGTTPAEIRAQVLDLAGNVLKDYPGHARRDPKGGSATVNVAGAAVWRDEVYVAVPGEGVVVFTASGTTVLGKQDGLPPSEPSALTVSGDSLVVGFQADYLGAIDLHDRKWREIAYSGSLLKRNPLDGCRSRFRVAQLLTLSDGSVWMVTTSPCTLWQVQVSEGTLKQIRYPHDGCRLLENDGRLLVANMFFLNEVDPRTYATRFIPLAGDIARYGLPHLMMSNDVISAGMKGMAVESDGRGDGRVLVGRGGLYLHKQNLRQGFLRPMSTSAESVHVDFMVRTSGDTALLATASGQFWKLTDLHRELPEEKAATDDKRLVETVTWSQTNALEAKVTSSSYAIFGTNAFLPELVQDGNPYTCWAAATNDIVGAWVEFAFRRPVSLSGVRIVNGWFKAESDFTFYPINHRAKRLLCATDAGEEEAVEVEDHHDPQLVLLHFAEPAKRLRLTVAEIFRAEVEQPNDPPWLNISEMTFFGAAQRSEAP